MEILDTAQPKPEVGTLLQVTTIIKIFSFFIIASSLVRFIVMSSFFDSLLRPCGLQMGHRSYFIVRLHFKELCLFEPIRYRPLFELLRSQVMF